MRLARGIRPLHGVFTIQWFKKNRKTAVFCSLFSFNFTFYFTYDSAMDKNSSMTVNPLVDPIPAEVPLRKAPLVRVIAQVRFPTIAAIESPQLLAPFQEAIRGRYPFLRQEKSPNIVFGSGGLQLDGGSSIWRFSSSSEHKPSDGWTIALTKDFLALETQKYTSRKDFMERLAEAVEALQKAFAPPGVDRLGVRYIDRIEGEDVEHLQRFIQPHILGVLAMPISDHVRQHALTDVQFSIDAGNIRARWGRLPARSTFDPVAIDPIEKDSWVLDLDAFSENKALSFEPVAVVALAREFAERIYAMFRWAVTDDFLKRFGGEP